MLPPHSFDTDVTHNESTNNGTFDSQARTLVEATGSQRENFGLGSNTALGWLDDLWEDAS
jgi:hypothetical protein